MDAFQIIKWIEKFILFYLFLNRIEKNIDDLNIIWQFNDTHSIEYLQSEVSNGSRE